MEFIMQNPSVTMSGRKLEWQRTVSAVRWVPCVWLGLIVLSCEKQDKKAAGDGGKKSIATVPVARPQTGGDKTARDISPAGKKASMGKLEKALEGNGAQGVSDLVASMSPEEIGDLLGSDELRGNQRLAGILAVIYAGKAGMAGREEDFQVLVKAPCELNQLGLAAAEFFKAAAASGKTLDLSKIAGDLGSGVKRKKVLEGYFASDPRPLADIVKAVGELGGYPEDVQAALTGAAKSRNWSPSELEVLITSRQENLIPSFLRSGMRDYLINGASPAELESSWGSIDSIASDSNRIKMKSAFVSEVGSFQPDKAIDLLSGESHEVQKEVMATPGFAKVVKRWVDLDPPACLEFVTTKGLESEEEQRLVGVAFTQWLAVDSMAASEWLQTRGGQAYYDAAAKKVISFLKSKGNDKEAAEWEAAISKK